MSLGFVNMPWWGYVLVTLVMTHVTIVGVTVYLHRYPVGEWVYLRSRTDAEPNGVALAQSELFDRDGAIGHGLQSLCVDTWEQFGGRPPEQKL